MLLVLVQTLFNIRKGKVYAKASSNILNGLRRKMISSVLQSECKELEKSKKGDLLTAFQYSMDGLDGYFMNGVSELLGSLVTIIITLGVMLALNWLMTLITLPVFPVLLLLFSRMQKSLRKGEERCRTPEMRTWAF